MRSANGLRAFVGACLISMAGVAFAGTSAFACGYHNPDDVARGLMNFVFPKSLYVRTAVWQAQHSGVLPPRAPKPAKDLFAYQGDVARLQKLGTRLAPAKGEAAPFAVVLLDSMLWTRFVPGPDGYSAAIHVKGPEKGDAVIVTESPVIKALLADTLDVKEAEAHGLFRLYGPIDRQAAARTALGAFSSGNAS